jgi:hypothetical protein
VTHPDKAPAAEKAVTHDIPPVPRDVTQPPPGTPTSAPTPTPVEGPGRTFIQPTERPDVGTPIISKTRDA